MVCTAVCIGVGFKAQHFITNHFVWFPGASWKSKGFSWNFLVFSVISLEFPRVHFGEKCVLLLVFKAKLCEGEWFCLHWMHFEGGQPKDIESLRGTTIGGNAVEENHFQQSNNHPKLSNHPWSSSRFIE